MKEESKHQASKHEDQMNIGSWIDFRLRFTTKLPKKGDIFQASHHFQLPSSSINILKVVHLSQPTHLHKKPSPKGHIDLLKASWILHTSPFKWPFLCWVVKELCACVKQGPQQNYSNEHRKPLVFKRKLLKYDTSPTCKMPPNVGGFWRDDPLLNYEFAVLNLIDAPTKTFLKIS